MIQTLHSDISLPPAELAHCAQSGRTGKYEDDGWDDEYEDEEKQDDRDRWFDDDEVEESLVGRWIGELRTWVMVELVGLFSSQHEYADTSRNGVLGRRKGEKGVKAQHSPWRRRSCRRSVLEQARSFQKPSALIRFLGWWLRDSV